MMAGPFLPPVRRCTTSAGIVQYRELGAANRDCIVLLHGIGAASATWDTQITELQDQFRMIAWDAPGYADSSALPADAPRLDDYAGALAEFLDAVQAPKAHLVASSWGTLIALALAARMPERVGKIVLSGPTTGYAHLPMAEKEGLLARRTARVKQSGIAQMMNEDAHMLIAAGSGEPLRERVVADSGDVHEEGYLQALHPLFSGDGVALIAQVRNPVLIISGELDAIAPAAMHAQRLAAARPQTPLISFAGCGHLPHRENPVRFNAELLSFINPEA